MKLESLLNDERRVGVIDEIVVGDAVVLQRVVDYPAEKGDVGAGTNLKIQIRSRGCPREARIDYNGLRIAVNLGLDGPLEAARMVLGWIPAHDQHHVGVLDVDPAIGYCPASEGWPQTGDRGAVSNAGLVFQVADPQAAHALDDEIVEFVGVGAAAREGDSLAAVHGMVLRVSFEKSVVAGFLYLLRDLVVGVFPGDIFPLGRARTSDLRLQQPAVVEDVLFEGRALRAERTPIDGMIGIALDMDHLRDRVLRLVTQGVDDHAAADRTVRTRTASFGCAGDLQTLGLCVGGSEVESQGGQSHAPHKAALEKSTAGELHAHSLRGLQVCEVTEVEGCDRREAGRA